MKTALQFGQSFSTPNPELEDDDLSFLQSMIHKKEEKTNPLDFDFLKNELMKRRPPPDEKSKNINLPEKQIQVRSHKPKYIQACVPPPTFPSERESAYDFQPDIPPRRTNEIPSSQKSKIRTRSIPNTSKNNQQQEISNIQSISFKEERFNNSLQREPTSPNPEFADSDSQENFQTKRNKPAKYVSWKYIGYNDGTFGIYTGKVDLDANPSSVQKALADIPYTMENTKFSTNEIQTNPTASKKVKPRDLFRLSINEGTNEMARWQEKKRARKKAQMHEETESRLYLESGDKLMPLAPSHLHPLPYNYY